MRCLLCLGLLLGCSAEESSEGTIVGNPGKLRAARSAAVSYEEGSARVTWVALEGCDGETGFEEELESTVDLVGETDAFAGLPDGTWCSASVELTEVFLEGSVDGVFVALEIEELELGVGSGSGFTLDEGLHTLWQLGPPDLLDEVVDGEADDVFIDEEHEAYDDVLAAFEDRSAVYEDLDQDGQISAGDEAGGTLATGVDRDAEASDEGGTDTGGDHVGTGGCGRSKVATVLWLPLLFGLRRRR